MIENRQIIYEAMPFVIPMVSNHTNSSKQEKKLNIVSANKTKTESLPFQERRI